MPASTGYCRGRREVEVVEELRRESTMKAIVVFDSKFGNTEKGNRPSNGVLT